MSVDDPGLQALIARATREDGASTASDSILYEEVSSGIVWGPGGVLVWDPLDRQWSWADDLDEPSRYYTQEYRRRFP